MSDYTCGCDITPFCGIHGAPMVAAPASPPERVQVQACREEDRAMAATTEGAAMIRAAADALANEPNVTPTGAVVADRSGATDRRDGHSPASPPERGPDQSASMLANPGCLWTVRRYPCGCKAEGPGDVPAYCATHGSAPAPAAASRPEDTALIESLRRTHDVDCELYGDPEDHTTCCTCSWVERNEAAAALAQKDAEIARLRTALLGATGAFEALKLIGADRHLPGFQATLDAVNAALAKDQP